MSCRRCSWDWATLHARFATWALAGLPQITFEMAHKTAQRK